VSAVGNDKFSTLTDQGFEALHSPGDFVKVGNRRRKRYEWSNGALSLLDVGGGDELEAPKRRGGDAAHARHLLAANPCEQPRLGGSNPFRSARHLTDRVDGFHAHVVVGVGEEPRQDRHEIRPLEPPDGAYRLPARRGIPAREALLQCVDVCARCGALVFGDQHSLAERRLRKRGRREQ